jgi:hypothetical protein
VVFIVHYLDATKTEDGGKVSELVKRSVRGKGNKDEPGRVEKYFHVWTGCVSDAVRLSCVTQQDLRIVAVVSGFGGLPAKKRDAVEWLPPTLIVMATRIAIRELATAKKLRITVKIYDNVGHMFQKEEGKFDMIALQPASSTAANAPKNPAP